MRKRDPLEGVPPPASASVSAPARALPAHDAEVRRRQRSRSIVMGLALIALVALIYAITIVRIGGL